MFAPRRVPPCFTASVAPLKTRRNDTGPEALPPVEVDDRILLAEAREGEAGAAARLVDDGGRLHRVEDLLHGVADREDVAGRVLELVPLPRVHEGRGVRQELAVDHQVVEGAGDLVDHRRALAPALLPLGDGRRPPASTSPRGSPGRGPPRA